MKNFKNLLTLSFPATFCAGHNINLLSKSNISKTLRANIAFIECFIKSIR